MSMLASIIGAIALGAINILPSVQQERAEQVAQSLAERFPDAGVLIVETPQCRAIGPGVGFSNQPLNLFTHPSSGELVGQVDWNAIEWPLSLRYRGAIRVFVSVADVEGWALLPSFHLESRDNCIFREPCRGASTGPDQLAGTLNSSECRAGGRDG